MEKVIALRSITGLYKEPDACSERIDEMLYGMEGEILEDLGAYVKLKTFYRYEGYVKKEELITEKTLVSKWQQGDLYVVTKSYADILNAPKVQGSILCEIPRGGLIEKTAKANEDGWVSVRMADGQSGYTKESFLSPLRKTPVKDEESLRKSLVETAKGYLGTQYRWGGKSPLGIDCSGLVSMSYLLNGIIIYRDARLEEGFPMKEIPFEDKKPGDALYFPGHIAMYMGNDLYIHSTGKNGSDGVVINSLDPADPLYREDLPGKLLATGSVFPF